MTLSPHLPRLAIAGLLCGVLGGCGTGSTATATTATNAAITTVAAAEIALTAAETTSTAYIKQPACPKGVVQITCSDPATVALLKSYDQTAYTAVKAAEAGTATLAAAVAALNAYTAATPAAAPAPVLSASPAS